MSQNLTYGKFYQAIDLKNEKNDILREKDPKFLNNSDTFTYVNPKKSPSKPIQVNALTTLSQTMILKSPRQTNYQDFSVPQNLRFEGGKGGGVFQVNRGS
jgi:hypothetical protein